MCGSDCQDGVFALIWTLIIVGTTLLCLLPVILTQKNKMSDKDFREIETALRYKSYHDIDQIKENTRK